MEMNEEEEEEEESKDYGKDEDEGLRQRIRPGDSGEVIEGNYEQVQE